MDNYSALIEQKSEIVQEQTREIRKRQYTKNETAFVWISWILSFFFCRFINYERYPVGMFAVTVAAFIITSLVLIKGGLRLDKKSFALLTSALLVSFSYILTDNSLISFISFCYTVTCYIYFIYCATGNSVERGISELTFFELLKATWMMPFSSIGESINALKSKKNEPSRYIVRIIIGIALAIIPTLIIFALLSFDNEFTRLIDILIVDEDEIIKDIFSAAFGFLIGLYVFALFIASKDKRRSNVMSKEACDKALLRIKVIHCTSACVAVLPVLVMYIVFFVAQFNSYFSSFSGMLPEGTIYSEYARKGFFELCWVSFINFVILACLNLFTKSIEDRGTRITVKLLNCIISVFTLVLISTAISKLIMYINAYGLTQKRVYAAWFIILLALVFVIIIIRQFASRLNAITVGALLCVVMFIFLAFVPTDTLIAKYNISRAADGSIATVDVEALKELGTSAVPELIEYAKTIDKNSFKYENILKYLDSVLQDEEQKGIMGMSLPSLRARRAIEEFYKEME